MVVLPGIGASSSDHRAPGTRPRTGHFDTLLCRQSETLDFLTSYGLPYVVVDLPQGYPSSIPAVVAATASDLAVVRFHRHSDRWDSRDIYERFGYLYSEQELQEWASKLRDLAAPVKETQVLLNNCYRNYAQANAGQLADLVNVC